MRQRNDYTDTRSRGFCIYCGTGLDEGNGSRDYIQTRGVLDYPLPDNFSAVHASQRCNSGFSDDEPYLVALIVGSLTGSPELCRDRFSVAGGITYSGGSASVGRKAEMGHPTLR